MLILICFSGIQIVQISPTKYQFLMASLAMQNKKNKCAQLLDSKYNQYLHQLFAPAKESFWSRVFGCGYSDKIEDAIREVRSLAQDRSFFHAFGMLLAIQQYYTLQGKDIHTQQIYTKFQSKRYFTIKAMSLQEKIVCLEKQILILEQNQTVRKEYKQEFAQKLNQLIDYYLQQDKIYMSSNRQAVQTTFKKIYKIFGDSQRVDRWFRYEQKQRNPDYTHILQTLCEYPSQDKKVIILIHQRKFEQARNQLSKGKKGKFYFKIINFLTLINLRLFSQMTLFFVHFDYENIQEFVLRQTVNHQKELYQGQTKEEKVINHLKWIDYYEKQQCYSSMSQAYRSMISMLLQGFPLPNCQKIAQKNKEMQILYYYKKLLYSKSKQKFQMSKSYLQVQSYMGRIFSYIIKAVLQQAKPNYSELLQIREKYFENPLIDALIYICSGDFQKARIIAHCCNLREYVRQPAMMIWKTADLMEKKKYSRVKEVTKEIKKSMEGWIEDLVDQIENMTERSEQSQVNILND